MKGLWVLKSIKILVMAVFFVVVMGSMVMWLWNGLMPHLFNLPYITFGQAIGLLVLTRILSGGFRLGLVGDSEHWEQKRQIWEKWSSMTAEERQKWKEDWRSRCQHSRRKMEYTAQQDTPDEQI